ncbi:MAG TPA: peroxiredoxin family protein [Bacteroidia bacterium]|nr:peroxiredoxin family protein [Bacteroidia bacterium]
MKKIGLLSLLVWALFLFTIYLIINKMYVQAVSMAAITYLLSGLQTQTITGRLHVIHLLTSSVLLSIGILLYQNFNFPSSLAAFSVITCTLPFSIRIWAYRKFLMTRFLWMEAIVISIALLLYILSINIDENIFLLFSPLATLGFTGGIAMGMFFDTPGLLKAARKEYGITAGRPAPDFTLPDQDGNMVTLSDYIGKRNLLLIFVRGDWCPWCHMMLRTYQREIKRFEEKNIMLIAIGPDPKDVNHQMVEKLGLDYRVLADNRQQTASVYGCQLSHEENKNLLTSNPIRKHYEEGLPLPASFLIDKKGMIIYTSRPDRVGEPVDIDNIFPALKTL